MPLLWNFGLFAVRDLQRCRPAGVGEGVACGTFSRASLGRVVEGEGVIKCITVIHLTWGVLERGGGRRGSFGGASVRFRGERSRAGAEEQDKQANHDLRKLLAIRVATAVALSWGVIVTQLRFACRRNQVSWRLANWRVRIFTSSTVWASERSPRRCSMT